MTSHSHLVFNYNQTNISETFHQAKQNAITHFVLSLRITVQFQKYSFAIPFLSIVYFHKKLEVRKKCFLNLLQLQRGVESSFPRNATPSTHSGMGACIKRPPSPVRCGQLRTTVVLIYSRRDTCCHGLQNQHMTAHVDHTG